MEKFKVSFVANNQQLTATGTKHASDTYADIEATFALGERWTDMDSVSAVWWNDFTRIATVLDSEGKCTVPHEVLMRKGCVRVNLVGSVVENGELVTRLTSYSAEAVHVNEKIKLTGSETTEITPSQFEQFVENVKADADRAESAKESAQDASASAQGYAQSASASASSASESATSAEQSATASARDAQTVSEIAVEVEVMKNEAELARDEILGMSAEAVTLPAGSEATASYADGLLSLGIPRGNTGATGAKGDKGDTGATPNLTIGDVETLEPTESATATITGTAENPVLNLGIPQGDTGEVSLADLSTLLPTDTASGAIASFPDGQSVIPMVSLLADIEPLQDLHGYDKPWSGGNGKNKLEVTATTATKGGVTFTVNDDGTAVVNGTASGWSGVYQSYGTAHLKANTEYKLCSEGSINGTLYCDVYNGSTIIITTQYSSYPSASFSVDEDTTVTLNIVVFYNKTVSNTTIKPMIRLATVTDDTYEPYSNICPISGRTEVETVVSPTTSAEDGSTYTTTLGRTVYGGTLDVVSGELVVDRAMVDMGTMNWRYGTWGGHNQFNAILADSVNNPAGNISGMVSSAYTEVSPNTFYTNGADGTMALNGITVIIANSNYTDAASLKTAMSGVQLVYELATPQTIQLTPQEVYALLGQNNVWADSGAVEVVYRADVGLYIDKKLN